jgi:hypothetical protein
MKIATPSRDALKLELAAEVLREFAEVQFVARGSSMLPTIYPGDCLMVRAFGDGGPRCGDIVLYRRGDEFRVHRLVRILGEGSATIYVLRGDALTEEDAPVRGGELLGRVTSLARREKFLKLRRPIGVGQCVLRLMVRQSKIAGALLLGWHAMQERYFPGAESLAAGAGKTRAEYL